jgi:CheY-like chemotaxis protein
MPDLHGFKVLEWLRNHPPHDVHPVVVLTVSGEAIAAQIVRLHPVVERSHYFRKITGFDRLGQ